MAGLKNGKLRPLGVRPNQVSTQTDKTNWQKMEPLPLSGTALETATRVKAIIEEQGGYLVAETGDWLHFEFYTRFFTDDVEFQIDEGAGLLHFRSSSRLGWGDRGVNRKRMRRFSEAWARSG